MTIAIDRRCDCGELLVFDFEIESDHCIECLFPDAPLLPSRDVMARRRDTGDGDIDPRIDAAEHPDDGPCGICGGVHWIDAAPGYVIECACQVAA